MPQELQTLGYQLLANVLEMLLGESMNFSAAVFQPREFSCNEKHAVVGT